jgi:hypothetical protein
MPLSRSIFIILIIAAYFVSIIKHFPAKGKEKSGKNSLFNIKCLVMCHILSNFAAKFNTTCTPMNR